MRSGEVLRARRVLYLQEGSAERMLHHKLKARPNPEKGLGQPYIHKVT